jgi:tetratricopeptide (TPR) repeat protein
MEKAIAIDPGFAMAYRSVAMAYGNLGYSADEKKNIQKAFELSDRASDRERYIIQGDYYSQSESTYDKAIEAYNKLLALYPDDRIGNANSAAVYSRLEEWDKAIERNEMMIKNKEDSIIPYSIVGYEYIAKGQYEKAKEAPELYIKTFGDNFNMRWELGLINLCQGKYDSALIEVEKALTLNPNDDSSLWIRGYIYFCRGDFKEAEKDFQKLLDSEEKISHLDGRGGIASLYLLQGKSE